MSAHPSTASFETDAPPAANPSDAVALRLNAWRGDFRPETPAEECLFAQAVTCSVRVDECQRHLTALRGQLARRAALCWDDDRRLAAEALGDAQARKPALTARKLRRPPPGAVWLLGR